MYNESSKYFKKLNKLLLTLCSCHVMDAFQSESTLYSCLNVNSLLEAGMKSEV